MPHDKRGTELKVGDTVMVPCTVKAIHLTEDYCNVDLETKLTMPPQQTVLKASDLKREYDAEKGTTCEHRITRAVERTRGK